MVAQCTVWPRQGSASGKRTESCFEGVVSRKITRLPTHAFVFRRVVFPMSRIVSKPHVSACKNRRASSGKQRGVSQTRRFGARKSKRFGCSSVTQSLLLALGIVLHSNFASA